MALVEVLTGVAINLSPYYDNAVILSHQTLSRVVLILLTEMDVEIVIDLTSNW